MLEGIRAPRLHLHAPALLVEEIAYLRQLVLVAAIERLVHHRQGQLRRHGTTALVRRLHRDLHHLAGPVLLPLRLQAYLQALQHGEGLLRHVELVPLHRRHAQGEVRAEPVAQRHPMMVLALGELHETVADHALPFIGDQRRRRLAPPDQLHLRLLPHQVALPLGEQPQLDLVLLPAYKNMARARHGYAVPVVAPYPQDILPALSEPHLHRRLTAPGVRRHLRAVLLALHRLPFRTDHPQRLHLDLPAQRLVPHIHRLHLYVYLLARQVHLAQRAQGRLVPHRGQAHILHRAHPFRRQMGHHPQGLVPTVAPRLEGLFEYALLVRLTRHQGLAHQLNRHLLSHHRRAEVVLRLHRHLDLLPAQVRRPVRLHLHLNLVQLEALHPEISPEGARLLPGHHHLVRPQGRRALQLHLRREGAEAIQAHRPVRHQPPALIHNLHLVLLSLLIDIAPAMGPPDDATDPHLLARQVGRTVGVHVAPRLQTLDVAQAVGGQRARRIAP